jgi:hypothetical protein
MDNQTLEEITDKALEGLAAYAKTRGIDQARLNLNQFMIEYLSELEDSLPDAARNAFNVVRNCKRHDGKMEEIKSLQEDCWRFLKETKLEYDFESQPARAVRAVLCVLDGANADNDMSDLCYWFIQFAFHPRKTDLMNKLIRQKFPEK